MSGAPDRTPIRVVIADDHPLVRSGTEAELARHADIAVVGATGQGRNVLSLVERTRPDVLVLDIHMPDLNGVDVARQVRERYPWVAIVVVTGYDDASYVRALLRIGILGYLNKAAPASQLVAAVYAASRGEQSLSGNFPAGLLGRGMTALTSREQEVLQLLIAGRRNNEIAADLGVSINTVEFHVGKIYQKLEVRSRAEAIGKARELGLITPPGSAPGNRG